MEEQQDPRVEALTRQFLQEALEEVLSSDGRPAPDGTPACDAESLEVLRQTAQVRTASCRHYRCRQLCRSQPLPVPTLHPQLLLCRWPPLCNN